MSKMFRKPSQLTEEISNNAKSLPHLSVKQITEINYKVLEQKIEQVKEACLRLKNDSSKSKNDALREIKNICNSKAEMEKEWQRVLGEGA